MAGKVLCIGDIILDSYCHGEVRRISPEAPIPVLKINSNKYEVLGGCGDYTYSWSGNVFGGGEFNSSELNLSILSAGNSLSISGTENVEHLIPPRLVTTLGKHL